MSTLRSALLILLALGCTSLIAVESKAKASLKKKSLHGKKSGPKFINGNADTLALPPSNLLNLTGWALQETNTGAYVFNPSLGYPGRFYLDPADNGVAMVVYSSPLNDTSPSPRVELLYNTYFNGSGSKLQSMNITIAVMNFMPSSSTNGNWTSIAQIFRQGGTCGKGAGMMVRATLDAKYPTKAQIAVTSKTNVSGIISTGYLTLGTYTLGQKLSLSFLIKNNTIQFIYNGVPTVVHPIVPCDTFAWKVGNYYLQTGRSTSVTDSAMVKLYSLSVSK